MRFIHTADWHLGRVMHGVPLIEDQAHALDQVIDLVREVEPDAFLISGDVYDRPVPSKEAVELLDDFLSRLVLEHRVTVVIIAGNHDSPSRLEFAARVMAGQGLHVSGSILADPVMVTLRDRWGAVRFYAIPFAEPALVREALASDTIRSHEEAMAAVLDRVRSAHPAAERSVLIGHAFVGGGTETESERPLSIGGADRVDCSCFSGFNYVALGHLHRPQAAGASHVRYPGSLLKYSFSEADHGKGLNVVEMDGSGVCRVETIPLTPRRDVRIVEGYLEEILQGPETSESREDYLLVRILDTGALLDVMGKLREVYPNVLHVERPGLEMREGEARNRVDRRKLNDADLFADFFGEVTGTDLSAEELAVYESIVDQLRQRDREAVSP